MNRLLKNMICFFAGFLAVCVYAKAMGAEPQQYSPPLASFIVMQCDEVVVAWWISGDNKAHRMDPTHRPEQQEYAAVLKWLQSGKTDVYTMPCLDTASGGRQHTKEKS